MSAETLEDEVISLVAEQTGSRFCDLGPQTTLFGDIGVDGDDGVELLMAFMERFKVDMASCQVRRHFGPEGFVPWVFLYWALIAWRSVTEKGSTPESRARLVPIAIQDLIDSAKTGKWVISYDQTA